MSVDDQGTKCHRNIAENFNRLSIGCTSVADKQTTDGRAIAYSEREREFTFAKNDVYDVKHDSREELLRRENLVMIVV